MKKYIGSHSESALPIKKGQRVRIPKGVIVHTTHPLKDRMYVSKKTIIVTVHHILNGMSVPMHQVVPDGEYLRLATDNGGDIDRYETLYLENAEEYYTEMVPIENPEVVWAGSAGYWCRVDINEVEKVT